MKKSRYLAYFIALIGTVAHLEGAYVIKDGKLVDAKIVATLPVEEHYRLGVEAMNKKDWKEASDQFRILSVNFADTPLGQDAYYYYGISEYNLQELDGANDAFTEYLKGQNNPQFFEETMQYKYSIACELKNGAKVRMFGSRHCPRWASGKELAIEIFDEVITALPCHDLTVNAHYYKGELLCDLRLYRDSIDVYLQLIRRFPKHELAPQSYLRITEVYLEQCKREFQNPDLIALADLIVRRFKVDFPRSELISRAESNFIEIKEVYAQGLYETGQLYERKKEPRASIIYYQSAITQFPETAIASLCRQRLSVLSDNMLQ
jgi:outer membrane protein assembly factor BamD (BamD/ComL family)